MDELAVWMAEHRDPAAQRVLVGDLNVAPLETDVWSHRQLLKVVSHTPVEVERFVRMQAAGAWTDAVRHFIPPNEKLYTWWSYRARDWTVADRGRRLDHIWRSEEHTSELQSLMRISYAVFCLKKKKREVTTRNDIHTTVQELYRRIESTSEE